SDLMPAASHPRSELGDLRQALVVGRAKFGRVDHGIKVAGNGPCAPKRFGFVLQRFDDGIPAAGQVGAGGLVGGTTRVVNQDRNGLYDVVGLYLGVVDGLIDGAKQRVVGHNQSCIPYCSVWAAAVGDRRWAACKVFMSSIAMVMGPTPPGTGVMAPAT